MFGRFTKVFCLVALVMMANTSRADISANVLRRAKKATALVEINGGEVSGTAFCIDPTGYFVTNEHVASALGGGKKLTLVLKPGEKDQQKLEAVVVRQDKDADLAILLVETNTTVGEEAKP